MSISVKIQRFGNFLSSMIMPNMGAFIAWGLITALFIPTGWFPNEQLGQLVGPMITYMLPILIGYTGGYLVYGKRGGALGVIATLGVIVGSDIPMFLGAMIMGPLGGYVIQKSDALIHEKIPSGFEMLVDNFLAGIVGLILAIFGLLIVGDIVTGISQFFGNAVGLLVDIYLLPLAAIFVEPAKVLFLNNAVNHGVFTPLGLEQVQETGRSLFFLIEANPGTAAGLLIAYSLFGNGVAKQSAPSALVIQFFGGIHELYFPYILMKPILLLGMIAGSITNISILMVTGAGLVAPASPGSILAVSAVAARGDLLYIYLAVLASGTVSFLVCSFLLKFTAKTDDFSSASDTVTNLKAQSKGADVISSKADDKPKNLKDVALIVVACDAGMGSSAMGANILLKKVKEAGLDIVVKNKAISQISKDEDIIITQENLSERAKLAHPEAIHLSLTNFLDKKFYDSLVADISEQKGK